MSTTGVSSSIDRPTTDAPAATSYSPHVNQSAVSAIPSTPSCSQAESQPAPTVSSTPPSTSEASVRKRMPSDFIFGRVLGEGSYSTVLHATERDPAAPNEYAVKILDKRHIIKEKKTKYVAIEKDVLNALDHPLVVKLYYTFQDAQSLYFVLELARDGDLLGFVRKLGCFTEDAARFYVAEIIVAVEYLHSKGIVHRDLKPENILLDENMHIKLTDFGTAKILDSDSVDAGTSASEKRNSFVGTAEYCSPELLNDRAASKSSDVWAIGCILYHLLAGKPPFKGVNEYQTFQKIIKLEYEFPDGFPRTARDLVSAVLVLDAANRPSLADIRAHPFFTGFDWSDVHLRPAPNLRPFLPAASAHDIEDLTSEMDALTTTGTGQFHGDVVVATRDPFENILATPGEVEEREEKEKEAVVAADPELEKQLHAQTSHPLRHLVLPTEVIIMDGTVVKRKGLFSKKRGLLLTNFPRLLFFDEKTLVAKSEIPWSDRLKVELKGNSSKHIFVHTPKRTYYLEAVNNDVRKWADAINALLAGQRSTGAPSP
ncbi:3-phosphoinositide dependent protein kinase-1 [Geranomyces michiganensis]|nr:3-phosphoinositide dependent protein kinase-1 [Geranomyces michiganensis]